MPQIAVSARVFGDVRVKLEVDRATGAVRRAVIVQGLPLLNDATLAAVRQWRFKPGRRPRIPST
jgi:TonB family protein